jgi:hypothetical protein
MSVDDFSFVSDLSDVIRMLENIGREAGRELLGVFPIPQAEFTSKNGFF